MSLKPPDGATSLIDGFTFSNTALEVNILDYQYLGVDRSGGGLSDSTAGINQAIQDVSAEAAARAALLGTGAHGRIIFPRGTYLSDAIHPAPNVTLELDAATIAKRSDSASNSATNNMFYSLETNVGGSYKNHYNNFKIKGGFLDPNNKTAYGSMLRLLWCDGLEVDGLEWLGYCDPAPASLLSGCNAIWYGGDHTFVHNLKIIGGSSIHDDGIHFVHGKYARILDCDINCGDDMVPIGSATSASLLAEVDDIQHVIVQGITGTTVEGFFVKVYVVSGMTCAVSDVVYSGCAAKTGINRNGGIEIQDGNAGVAGASLINRVKVEACNLEVGGATHDGVNAHGCHIESADNVSVTAHIEMTDNPADDGFGLAYIRRTLNTEIDLTCDELQSNNGPTGFWVLASGVAGKDNINMKIKGRMRDGGTSVNLPIIYLEDCPGTSIRDVDFENIQDGSNAVRVVGTTTTLEWRGGTVTHAAAATVGRPFVASPTQVPVLLIQGVNVVGAAQPIQIGSIADESRVVDCPGMSDLIPVPTIASVATLTPSKTSDVMKISGTANITSMTAIGYNGRTIMFIFTGAAATNGVVDGSNLRLAGDFPYTADDTMMLSCDGTNWWEINRSGN